MSKSRPYYFCILGSSLEDPRGELSAPGVRGFLDMLRYDQATISKIEGGVFVLRTEIPPTQARWKSFGIPVWNVCRDIFESIDRTRAEACGLPKFERGLYRRIQ